ncbi:MAG TPA: stalk domain-containing protein, partial [Bacillota bacterium]|nr:stalk domain-containing protein [Bacillota bacterium]
MLKKKVLAGCTLASTIISIPFVGLAAEIQPYQAQTIEPYQAQEIQPYQAQTIEPYKAQEVQPYQAQTIEPYKAQEVQPYQAQTIEPYQAKEIQPYKAQEIQPVQSQPVQPTQAQQVKPTANPATSNTSKTNSSSQGKVVLPSSYVYLQLGRTQAYANGKLVDLNVAPQLIDNHTMVPIRVISEALGCKVNWNAETNVITIVYKGQTIELCADWDYALVNGQKTSLEVSPQILEGTTVVPVRFISETFKQQVNYDPSTHQIAVLSKEAAQIQPYQSSEITPYKANEITPYQSSEVKPYQAEEVQPGKPADEVKVN